MRLMPKDFGSEYQQPEKEQVSDDGKPDASLPAHAIALVFKLVESVEKIGGACFLPAGPLSLESWIRRRAGGRRARGGRARSTGWNLSRWHVLTAKPLFAHGGRCPPYSIHDTHFILSLFLCAPRDKSSLSDRTCVPIVWEDKVLRKIVFALAVAGIVISALALESHYAAAAQPYSNNLLVLHSQRSMAGPIPVAVIGIAGYLLVALLAWFRRRGWTLLFAWIGLGYAAYLSYLEAYVLQAWCVYCVISQCLIALIAILAVADVVVAIVRKLNGAASSAVDQVVNHLRYG